MPTNCTPNYQLNQWEPEDAVRRVDFNADNAKIDAAIAAVAGSKASASELNSLRSTVNSLSSTVSGQGVTLGRKGNCQIEVTSYTGNGQATRTHTFPRKPVLFFIIGETIMFVGYGSTWTQTFEISDFSINTVWSGNSVTFSLNSTGTAHARAIGNVSGKTYHLIAFYDLSV